VGGSNFRLLTDPLGWLKSISRERLQQQQLALDTGGVLTLAGVLVAMAAAAVVVVAASAHVEWPVMREWTPVLALKVSEK
jgi:hypothetical protein